MNIVANKRKGALLGLFSILFIFGTSQQGQIITGIWKMEEDKKPMQVEMYLSGDGNYYGKIINDNSKKSKNGKVVFQELKYSENTNTYKGRMQSPDNDAVVTITIYFDNNNRLKVVGKKYLMTKTFHFSRIK
jgi:uncharacterized protein (DUF2147 family)